MSEERRLISVITRGNTEEISEFFELVYTKYRGLVAFVIAKFIQDDDIIKDLVHDVFVLFFENASNVKTNIKSYLTSTAKNISLNYLRKKQKETEFDENLYSIDEKNTNPSYQEIIAYLSHYLNEEELKIMLLHLIDDYTFKEIAKKLDIKENTAKSIYFRSLKKIERRI